MACPTIVLIHGMWSRPTVFAELRRELGAAGIETVALTLPHHDLPAQAPAPEALGHVGLADYLAALRQEIRTITGPVVLLGHSMGGLLAQQLAAETDPKGLILLATAPSAQAGARGAGFSLSAVPTLWRLLVRWGWWDKPIRLGEAAARYGLFNGVPEEELRQPLMDLTWDSGRAMAEIALPMLHADKPSAVLYHRLTMPSLVIAGLDDRIVPPAVSRRTARFLGQAGSRVDYEEWPATGHWLFHDAVRSRLTSAILHFIRSLD